MRVAAIGLLVLVIGLAVGCSKECDCVSPAPSRETVFALTFDQYTSFWWDTAGTGGSTVVVYFVTTDCSEIPSVTANGHKMNELYLENGSIQGSFWFPSGAPVLNYNYTISAHGKTTSGSIATPDPASNVVCNGVDLSACSSYPCPVPASTVLNLSWDCSAYDYFRLDLQGDWDGCSSDADDTSYTTLSRDIACALPRGGCWAFSSPSSFYLTLCSVKGASFLGGETPNVSGDYGKGYVLATRTVFFGIYPESTPGTGNAAHGGMTRDAWFEEQKRIARDFILAQ
jgi:hypothetical protein